MLANRLRELRGIRGLSQAELARRLNITQQAVAGWECGRTEPAHSMLIRLSEELQTTAGYLLGAEDVMLDGTYLSMARTLRENGISREDLELLLETHKRFAALNRRRDGEPE